MVVAAAWLWMLLYLGCDNQDEGCLDVYATNFKASADVNCCCTYPDLSISLYHSFDSLPFRKGNVYLSDSGTPYKVQELGIMLSQIHPMQESREQTVDDTIQVRIGSDTLLELEDNYLWVKPNAFDYKVGKFPYPGTYSGISITWGLDDEVNALQPDGLYLDKHPLASDVDSTWSEERGYFYFYMKMMPDTTSASIRINSRTIIMDASHGPPLKHEWTHTQQTGIAEDSEWAANLDYKILFGGVDFVADDENTIIEKMRANFSAAWTFSE